jgi:hypothetical protein
VTTVIVTGFLTWLALATGSIVFRNALLLRLHRASHVRFDQAPVAYAFLIELCHAWGLRRPRQFVIAADLRSRVDAIIASLTASMFCQRPAADRGASAHALATQPPSAIRIARLEVDGHHSPGRGR